MPNWPTGKRTGNAQIRSVTGETRQTRLTIQGGKKMLKKLMKKEEGFTLAELLIVVAIIAVLVAVSIPIFTAQLEKSRESTDMANLRAAKAAAVSAYLTQEAPLFNDGAMEACSYDATKGILVTGTSAPACGKGTDSAPNDDSFYTNEYGYKGASVADKKIVITPSGDTFTVCFEGATGDATPIGYNETSSTTGGGTTGG